jgi:hypothetical protein
MCEEITKEITVRVKTMDSNEFKFEIAADASVVDLKTKI